MLDMHVLHGEYGSTLYIDRARKKTVAYTFQLQVIADISVNTKIKVLIDT